jgi:hypothetical protein
MVTYRSEAAAIGRKFDSIHQRINVAAELPTLSLVAGQADLAPFLVATWRLLSGYEHAFSWALLKGSDSKSRHTCPAVPICTWSSRTKRSSAQPSPPNCCY